MTIDAICIEDRLMVTTSTGRNLLPVEVASKVRAGKLSPIYALAAAPSGAPTSGAKKAG